MCTSQRCALAVVCNCSGQSYVVYALCCIQGSYGVWMCPEGPDIFKLKFLELVSLGNGHGTREFCKSLGNILWWSVFNQ